MSLLVFHFFFCFSFLFLPVLSVRYELKKALPNPLILYYMKHMYSTSGLIASDRFPFCEMLQHSLNKLKTFLSSMSGSNFLNIALNSLIWKIPSSFSSNCLTVAAHSSRSFRCTKYHSVSIFSMKVSSEMRNLCASLCRLLSVILLTNSSMSTSPEPSASKYIVKRLASSVEKNTPRTERQPWRISYGDTIQEGILTILLTRSRFVEINLLEDCSGILAYLGNPRCHLKHTVLHGQLLLIITFLKQTIRF